MESLKKKYYEQLQGVVPTESVAISEHPYFFPANNSAKEWAVYQIMLSYLPFSEIAHINGTSKEHDGRSMLHYTTALVLYARDTASTITPAEAVNMDILLSTARLHLHNGQWISCQGLMNSQLANFTANELTLVNVLKQHIDNYVTNYYA